MDGTTLTVSPAADYNGDITVTVSASDGTLAGNSSFTLTVTPVNDAPVISAIADQSTDEDTAFVFTVSASDVDGDDLTYSASNGNATITVDGNVLTVDPESNYVGDSVITVNVSDGTVGFIFTRNETATGVIGGPGNIGQVIMNDDRITQGDSSNAGLVINYIYTEVDDSSLGGHMCNATPLSAGAKT